MVVDQDRTPNWEKWRHVPNVKLWEAVALSLNIEPGKVKHSKTGWMADAHLFEESQEFKDRIFIAVRNLGKNPSLHATAIAMDHPEGCEVSLASFAAWACSINWGIPQQLAEMAAEFNLPVDTPQANITNDETLLASQSEYWNGLQTLTQRALKEYPSWRGSQRKIQKSGNLQSWLTDTIGAKTREAEIIKNVLSDFFDELR